MFDKLWRPPVDVYEDGLLGQWRPEILRPAEAVASPRLFSLSPEPPPAKTVMRVFLSRNRHQPLRIAKPDDVFVRLVATIEQSSRALLSLRLAPVPVAPPKILRLLACDDAIEVASPVLTQAEGLDIGTLIECARTKNQEHPLAISRRKTLPANLTDVLVERGDQQVVLSTAKNAGSRTKVSIP